tara:strand:- start:549 stop:800 length:252 start_codon:yes stop_codon:yes gene_type:complete
VQLKRKVILYRGEYELYTSREKMFESLTLLDQCHYDSIVKTKVRLSDYTSQFHTKNSYCGAVLQWIVQKMAISPYEFGGGSHR